MIRAAAAPASIRFGTDGWRGVIADDFTFDHVRIVARAAARYILAHEKAESGVLVGYDCRFLSDRFARAAAEEIAAAGVPVQIAEGYVPTPALSFAVRNLRAAGAVMITASHNPWQWNGLKFKARYGGSADPSIVKMIEAELPHAMEAPPSRAAGPEPVAADFLAPYFEHLQSVVRCDKIARSKFQFTVDPMHGAARRILAGFMERHKIRCHEIHGDADPLFGGMNPEPIDPHIDGLRRAVVRTGSDAGFATDGDADRLGAVDRSGRFIDSHRIFSILLRYLVEVRGLRGGVAKTFSTTKMVDKLAAKYSLPVYETPIGFKYLCELMLKNDILIGGEESGGIGIPALGGPERDGILNSMLLAEAMAHYGKSLGEMVSELEKEFGPHQYGRIDLELRPGQKELAIEAVSRKDMDRFADRKIARREDMDGVKLYMQNGTWLLLRPSGTEPLLRIYAEAESAQEVETVLSRTEAFIRAL